MKSKLLVIQMEIFDVYLYNKGDLFKKPLDYLIKQKKKKWSEWYKEISNNLIKQNISKINTNALRLM